MYQFYYSKFHASAILIYIKVTCTEQCAAITPSTGHSENGSNSLSGRLIKSGLSKYLQEISSENIIYINEWLVMCKLVLYKGLVNVR